MQSFLKNFYKNKVYDEYKNQFIITWVLFDIDKLKVIWYICKKDFLNYFYFLLNNSKIIDWHTFFSKKETIFLDNYYEIIWKEVKNQDLKTIWYIYDIEFDLTNKLKFLHIETWFYFWLELSEIIKKQVIKISFNNILKFEKEYIIINEKEFLKENKKILENIKNLFINVNNPSYNTINFKKIWIEDN